RAFFGSVAHPTGFIDAVSPMSNTINAGCVTCEARNKKCDRTRGPAGCRRCVRAGIKCGGYPNSMVPRLKHNNRGSEPQASASLEGHSEYTNPGSIPSSSSIDPLVPGHNISRLGGNNSAAPTIEDLNFLDWSSGIPIPQYTNPHSSIANPRGQLPTPLVSQTLIPSARHIPTPLIQQNRTQIVQLLTPPDESRARTSASRARPGGPMTPGQASLFDSIFSLADNPPVLPRSPESPGSSVVRSPSVGSERSSAIGQMHNPDSHHQATPAVDRPEGHDDRTNFDDPENLQVGLLNELALDREVESNIVPFLAHCFTSWMSRFIFEPTQSISLARDTIIRGHTLGEEVRQKMILVANTVLAISKSTDYELTYFATLYKQVVRGVQEARACNILTREAAMKAMESCHEVRTYCSYKGVDY
ncbi:unnamed protein product, partial [Rhizoctonia solani]